MLQTELKKAFMQAFERFFLGDPGCLVIPAANFELFYASDGAKKGFYAGF